MALALVALGALGAPALHAAKPGQEILPVGREAVDPMPETAMDFEGVPALPQEEGPESTIDPELYRELKLQAGHDPFAQRPDVTVPLVKEEELTKATINRSFAGLDYATSVGSDGIFWPPDTILGKGGSQVIEATNHAIRLMTPTGAVVATKDLNTFFSSDPSVESVLFDPRVVYDRLGPQTRYFVVSLQRNDTAKTASVYLAVSRSSAPANLDPASWCRYKINSVRPATDSDGVTWADYPMVGVGADAFLILDHEIGLAEVLVALREADAAEDLVRVHLLGALLEDAVEAHVLADLVPGAVELLVRDVQQHHLMPGLGVAHRLRRQHLVHLDHQRPVQFPPA